MAPSPVNTDVDTDINAMLSRLRGLSQGSVQGGWRRSPEAEATTTDPPWQRDWTGWPRSPLNPRHHIAWPAGRTCLWLHQVFTWPSHRHGYLLTGQSAYLALRWWADQAEIYVEGRLVHSGDLFDCWTRLPLADCVVPGESLAVSLKLISPGHDAGALVESCLGFVAPAGQPPEPGFVADELTVLATYLGRFQPDQLPPLRQGLATLPWSQVGDRPRFDQALQELRQALLPLSPWLKQRTIHCLGHAHLDLAWLWPVADTWVAAERTFASVLALQREFPELTFSQSSPALLAWVEAHRPQLFAAIQGQVAAGRWGIDAGLWVEPDLNLPGGEAIARQLLYGQRYCLEKFGAVSALAWLPDSFGFSWQLPQLLRQAGVRFFATQKLRWNDTNPFPYDLYTWQGLDGSQIVALTLPPIGTDIDPLAMATYACDWEANTGQTDCLWLPGVGDHGGGPSREMLLQARRWAESPFFPRLVFGQAPPLLDQLTQADSAPLPVWQDELYLELHRGCYTTHADQKYYNRRCEDTLYQAELWASLATMTLQTEYPQDDLEGAWKQVLFNQFHDILPGSSIPEVFEQANQDWQAALDTAQQVLNTALDQLADGCALPPPPGPEAQAVLLFNPLNWARRELVELPLPPGPDRPWQGLDGQGQPLPTQVSQPPGQTVPRLLVHGPEVPALGYRLIWLVPTEPAVPAPTPPDWCLENAHLRVTIDGHTGHIAQLVDRPRGQAVLRAPGNQLQAFADQGQYWDAWNIDPAYQAHPLEEFSLEQIQWREYGPCRQTLRVVRRFRRSTILQDYSLAVDSPLLVIHTQVDWQESQVLVKAAFPWVGEAPRASYEIPFGAIDRPTTAATPQAAARWEVPALRWADLSQGEEGLSLLTDCKHGFDSTPHQLRLTLLKSPLWPDPQADRGFQQFTYALYPHRGSWQQAATVQWARNLSMPLSWRSPQVTPTAGAPDYHSFLDLGENSLVLAALKRSQDHPQRFILRLYESAGDRASCRPSLPSGWRCTGPVDLLETPAEETATGTPQDRVEVHPWQVLSLALKPVSPFP